ncbi:transcriptional regulator [Pilimelia anulata]|uniref:Transcriptional regulator n=1 Tax=Pilimelia anulata TaxID=53371 RepID=A0A8J3FAJ1_9ACTN|nr:metalloregulator ArsR/SmtB family transcription factor [Pilimelia anulata]GGJ75035.1 transcriptional regulator [Pilimelia anulata]
MHRHDDRHPPDDPTALPDPAQVNAAVTALRMLADPTRLRLLWLLTAGEHDVNTLATRLNVARPAISQHLAKLKLAGLVTVRRSGRHSIHRAAGAHVRRLVAEALSAADHHVRGIPDHD